MSHFFQKQSIKMMRNLLKHHLCCNMQLSIVKVLFILSLVQVFSIITLGIPQKKANSGESGRNTYFNKTALDIVLANVSKLTTRVPYFNKTALDIVLANVSRHRLTTRAPYFNKTALNIVLANVSTRHRH
ncbi:unnamed protein product [Schistosoma turkestanicum]|nr:unnamed protein product [Schistosoma turkestanicum]